VGDRMDEVLLWFQSRLDDIEREKSVLETATETCERKLKVIQDAHYALENRAAKLVEEADRDRWHVSYAQEIFGGSDEQQDATVAKLAEYDEALAERVQKWLKRVREGRRDDGG